MHNTSVPPTALALALGSVVSVQTGQAVAKLLFPLAGPAAMVAMRLGFAAAVLLLAWRPRLPAGPAALGLVTALGAATAGMNVFVYEAMTRMPLGVAVTVEFLGPLAVAVAGSRRVFDAGWAALAGAGVFLLAGTAGGGVALAGLILALAAGACWAAYILLNMAVGARTAGGQGLAWAMAVAALLVVPACAARAGSVLTSPLVLGSGLAVALLSSVIAYSLDLEALRRMPPRVFGVLLSLEPAVAALAGLAVLGERLRPLQWIGVCAVVAASAGVTWKSFPVRPGDIGDEA